MSEDLVRCADVLHREAVIMGARLAKLANDSKHLARALRNVTENVSLQGYKGEVRQQDDTQLPLSPDPFRPNLEGDYD